MLYNNDQTFKISYKYWLDSNSPLSARFQPKKSNSLDQDQLDASTEEVLNINHKI